MEQDIPGLTPELKAWIEAEIDRRVKEALDERGLRLARLTKTVMRTMADRSIPGTQEFVEAIGKKLDTL